MVHFAQQTSLFLFMNSSILIASERSPHGRPRGLAASVLAMSRGDSKLMHGPRCLRSVDHLVGFDCPVFALKVETRTDRGGDDPPCGGDRRAPRARLFFEGWKCVKLGGFNSWRKIKEWVFSIVRYTRQIRDAAHNVPPVSYIYTTPIPLSWSISSASPPKAGLSTSLQR
jgi:hypothetical protein